MSISLNSNQVSQLQNYLNTQQYADAYTYMRDIVTSQSNYANSNDLQALATWFDTAAHINANDGSFQSEFVRGSTEAVAASQGVTVTDKQFQDASNKLGDTLLNKTIQGHSIDDVQQVVNTDISNMHNELQIPEWGWSGAVGDLVPRNIGGSGYGGLGKDVAQVPAEHIGTAIKANLEGIKRAFDRAIQDGVVRDFEEFKAKLAKDFIKFGLGLGDFINGIEKSISDLFTGAQKSPYRGDPLTLDLNGDGLNTVPLKTPPLLFDINATGIKNSVGWVAPDDGLLVMDRNGNGMVDSGAELFGNATPAYGTSGNTADGFAALTQEDTNHDGVVDVQDANFASLRVWQDINQDGISQSGELTTLAQQGIVSFNVGSTQNSQILANGNQIANLGTFRRRALQSHLRHASRSGSEARHTFHSRIPALPVQKVFHEAGRER